MPNGSPNQSIIPYQPQFVTRPLTGKRGPTSYEFDWPTIERLLHIQCTQEEIAAILQVDINTLEDAVKRQYGCIYSELAANKRAGGKSSLRRAQWLKATEKNDTIMQIWLGKQYLGQSDKQVNLTLTADLNAIPEAKQEQLSKVLDALYGEE